MSLRSKIVILLSAVVLLYAGLDHVIQRAVVFQSFVSLENAAAEKDLDHVTHAIDVEVDLLARECKALASSAELVRFAGDGALAGGIERTLAPDALDAQSLHLVFVCDADGNVLHRHIHDWSRPTSIALKAFPPVKKFVNHPLLPVLDKHAALQGLLVTERGEVGNTSSADKRVMAVMLAASAPIIATPGGPVIGTVMTGRFLDQNMLDAIELRTDVHFDLCASDDPKIPAEFASERDEAKVTRKPVLDPIDDDHLSAFVCKSDLQGAPAVLIRASLGRDITAKGSVAVRYALVSTIAAGLLLMLVLLNMVQRTVLKPLGELTKHAVLIGRSEDFTKRIKSVRQDEVGVLAREFDGMIEKVAQSRAALVEAARAAGMSEIATGVLHNVGNVLNSVNVSANIAAEKARASSSSDLKRVMDALRPNADDIGGFIARDPRGKHLYPLLDSLTDKLTAEQAMLLTEIQALTEGIGHIKELVQSQQGYAGRAGVREMLTLSELIESALSITSQASTGSKDIQIVRQFETVPAMPVDRHRLIEILVNLIQNARQSVTEANVPNPTVTLRLSHYEESKVRIEVSDNGIGIPPENLARVFTHGFTTKKNGHGFGLHASANAATEMGGQLFARSEGKGHGATFVVELPITVPALDGALA